MTTRLDVLRAFEGSRIRYVLVGGMAVTLHGHVRATVDIDVIIDLVPDNAAKAIEVLTGLGLVPRLPVAATDFADDTIRESWVRDRNLTVFSMWHPDHPLLEVDLFADPPIDVAELLDGAISMPLGDARVNVASIEHLIRLKKIAARPQDMADIEALKDLRDE